MSNWLPYLAFTVGGGIVSAGLIVALWATGPEIMKTLALRFMPMPDGIDGGSLTNRSLAKAVARGVRLNREGAGSRLFWIFVGLAMTKGLDGVWWVLVHTALPAFCR